MSTQDSFMHHPRDYEFIKVLGKGSFGTVYHAWDKCRKKDVAIKVLTLNKKQHVDLENYEKEITFLQEGLFSKYISRLIATYRFEAEAWIVMEYCEAGTLDSLLSLPRLGRAFTETEAAAVMKMLLLGLQYMHDHKTIHRDVKGANVLVTARGECKLADFGLSRLLKNSVDKATSLEGSINKARTLCGTPLFVAPEIYARTPYDYKCDIWSLGMLVYVLLIANYPEKLRNMKPEEIFYTIPREDEKTWRLPAKQPGTFDPNISESGWDPRTEDFLARCLVKDPAARASASDLLRHPFITAVPRKLAVGQSPDEDDEGAGAAEVLSKHVNNCLELIRERAKRNNMTEAEQHDFKYHVRRGRLQEVRVNITDYKLVFPDPDVVIRVETASPSLCVLC